MLCGAVAAAAGRSHHTAHSWERGAGVEKQPEASEVRSPSDPGACSGGQMAIL